MDHCTSEHSETPAMCGMQDTVPAESSIISKLLEANNKATGTSFTHMYVKRKCKTECLCIFLMEREPVGRIPKYVKYRSMNTALMFCKRNMQFVAR